MCTICPYDKCKSCDIWSCYECFDGYALDFYNVC